MFPREWKKISVRPCMTLTRSFLLLVVFFLNNFWLLPVLSGAIPFGRCALPLSPFLGTSHFCADPAPKLAPGLHWGCPSHKPPWPAAGLGHSRPAEAKQEGVLLYVARLPRALMLLSEGSLPGAQGRREPPKSSHFLSSAPFPASLC